MKKRRDIKTTTFEADYGFMVEIVDTKFGKNNDPIWDIFIYREEYGIKMSIFGLSKNQTPTIEEAIEIVEANLPDYYSLYDEDYCEYDEVDRGYEDDYDFED